MPKLKNLVCFMLICALLIAQGLGQAAQTVKSAPLNEGGKRSGMVRVWLSSLGSPSNITLTIDGSYSAKGASSVALARGTQVRISFSSSSGQITMTCGGKSYEMGREMTLARRQSDGAGGVRIAQARKPSNLYPGDLQLVAVKNGSTYRLYPIVHVFMEDYLAGVVPYEMGSGASLEALKAQAVAARTYTMNRMNLRASMRYDVVDTTNDQVYYGLSSGAQDCVEAVNATRGIVLKNGDSLTNTYYTASNGGQTEAAQHVWGGSGSDYLGVHDDDFDVLNPSSPVKKTVVYADFSASGQNASLKSLLQSKANAKYSGAVIRRIDAITPHTPKYAAPSKLYTKLDFHVTAQRSDGQQVTLTLTCDIFTELESRLGMSINSSRNELWTVEKSGDKFILYARRFGHGVGMSQRGAMQMGAMGYSYDQILSFYYEGSRRVQYTLTRTILSGAGDASDRVIVTEEEPAAIDGACTAACTLDGQGLLDARSSRANVLLRLSVGDSVIVLGTQNGWALVRRGEVCGFVPTSSLNVHGEAPEGIGDSATKISQWASVKCSGRLNLRAGASASSAVRTTMADGTILAVFSVDGGWARVQYGVTVGYADVRYLVLTDRFPGEASTAQMTEAAVTTESGKGTVNLRAKASSSAKVLKKVRAGQRVTVLETGEDWCLVSFAGKTGYMMTCFLSQDEGSAPPPSQNVPEQENPGENAVVMTESGKGTVNLRAKASSSSKVLSKVRAGERVLVTKADAAWCSVNYGGKTGYMMTKYLLMEASIPPGQTPSKPADIETIGSPERVTACVQTGKGSLNLRRKSSSSASVIGQIPDGTFVTVLEKGNTWTRISWIGVEGYVKSSFLRFSGKEPISVPSATPPAEQASGTTERLLDETLMNVDERQMATVCAQGGLRVRAWCEKDAPVVTWLEDGAQIRVLQIGRTWCKIQIEEREGYCMTEFLIPWRTQE